MPGPEGRPGPGLDARGLVALVTTVPGLQDAFHMRPLDPELWVFLLLWPPLVLGVEETRKAFGRRR